MLRLMRISRQLSAALLLTGALALGACAPVSSSAADSCREIRISRSISYYAH